MPPIRFSSDDWDMDLPNTVSGTANTANTANNDFTNSEHFIMDEEEQEAYNQLIRLQQEEHRIMERERLLAISEIDSISFSGSDIPQVNTPPQKPTRSGKDFEKHFKNKLKKDYE